MNRTIAEKHIESIMADCNEKIKINVRFKIQEIFGDDTTISKINYIRLIERVKNIIGYVCEKD